MDTPAHPSSATPDGVGQSSSDESAVPIGPTATTTEPDMRPPCPLVAAPPSENRLLTIPNLVTVVRLGSLPVFLWLLFGLGNRAVAAYLLAGLGATDWVDGYIARRLGQVSNVGKVLDPVADRMLLLVGVGGILADGSVPTVFALVVLAREALVGGATVGLAALGARRIDVTWFGKAGTFGMMVSFPLFLVSHADLSWADTAGVFAWIAGIPALGLSLWAAVLYVPLGRRALVEGRATRQAHGPSDASPAR